MSDEYDRIPRFSKSVIDARVQGLIDWFSTQALDRPTPTPLATICDRIQEKGWLDFDFNADLGTSARGNKIYGAFDARAKKIYVDKSLDPNGPQFTFTLAHELGHFVLHRGLRLNYAALDEPANALTATRRSIYFARQSEFVTDRDWLEWHANCFAISLLLPRISFDRTVRVVQRSAGINRHLGFFYLSNSVDSLVTYRACVDDLAEIYAVPRSLVTKRLTWLEMVIDTRKGLDHFSKLFSESIPF